jgi:hypothetical protein
MNMSPPPTQKTMGTNTTSIHTQAQCIDQLQGILTVSQSQDE